MADLKHQNLPLFASQESNQIELPKLPMSSLSSARARLEYRSEVLALSFGFSHSDLICREK